MERTKWTKFVDWFSDSRYVLRQRLCMHRWTHISFVYGSYTECDKCGKRA